ncbi:MAG: hypothetical protein E6K80_05015 [Candidatus Eisenbacteria bacterium]|uniref:Uncharacterized protein n=1 Tax=Eiseniibacteriota bacterium TaxID=2212470 RepID=A0A538U700_UNCEI|nr:MAG: hypothetical protein E6K80_05015 [Candidatus Eisenbacteria bacterium]
MPFLPGLLLAIGIHSLYNHLLFNPLLATSTILVLTPLLLVVAYETSERAMRVWLGTGLDSDVERLELILSGEERLSPIGEYLDSLRHRFEGPILADMLCLLRIHLELSIRAKGTLIARAAGLDLPVDDDVRARLDELRYLERRFRRAGVLACRSRWAPNPPRHRNRPWGVRPRFGRSSSFWSWGSRFHSWD